MPKISELPEQTTSIPYDSYFPMINDDPNTKKVHWPFLVSQIKGYRSYVAILYYDNINNELIITEVQNDGFSVGYSEISDGKFEFEDLSEPFLENKTFIMVQQDNNLGAGADYSFVLNTAYRHSDSIIKFEVLDIDLTNNQVYYTNGIRYCSLEIRVYP